MEFNTAQINHLFIPGPAGRLEALLNTGTPDASHAGLVCHPHPLFGGTLHNKVVFHAMKALNSFGFPVLRFNFRGTGRSDGKHSEGLDEPDDVRSALDWLEHEFHLPIILAGFSFGAAVGLRASCPDPRVVALISLGTPVEAEVTTYDYTFLEHCGKTKLFVSGSQDPYGPRAAVEDLFARAAEPKRLVWIQATDHFFAGHLQQMRKEIENWIREVVLGRSV